MCKFQDVELALKAIERGDRETALRLLHTKYECALCLNADNKGENALCMCEMQTRIEITNLIMNFFWVGP